MISWNDPPREGPDRCATSPYIEPLALLEVERYQSCRIYRDAGHRVEADQPPHRQLARILHAVAPHRLDALRAVVARYFGSLVDRHDDSSGRGSSRHPARCPAARGAAAAARQVRPRQSARSRPAARSPRGSPGSSAPRPQRLDEADSASATSTASVRLHRGLPLVEVQERPSPGTGSRWLPPTWPQLTRRPGGKAAGRVSEVGGSAFRRLGLRKRRGPKARFASAPPGARPKFPLPSGKEGIDRLAAPRLPRNRGNRETRLQRALQRRDGRQQSASYACSPGSCETPSGPARTASRPGCRLAASTPASWPAYDARSIAASPAASCSAGADTASNATPGSAASSASVTRKPRGSPRPRVAARRVGRAHVERAGDAAGDHVRSARLDLEPPDRGDRTRLGARRRVGRQDEPRRRHQRVVAPGHRRRAGVVRRAVADEGEPRARGQRRRDASGTPAGASARALLDVHLDERRQPPVPAARREGVGRAHVAQPYAVGVAAVEHLRPSIRSARATRRSAYRTASPPRRRRRRPRAAPAPPRRRRAGGRLPTSTETTPSAPSNAPPSGTVSRR